MIHNGGILSMFLTLMVNVLAEYMVVSMIIQTMNYAKYGEVSIAMDYETCDDKNQN